jgi:hypothetical protein
MLPLQRISSVMSRIERVVMLSLIRLLLNSTDGVVPSAWTAVIYASVNIGSMALLHTVPHRSSIARVLSCTRRVSLFIFTHAVMRASLGTGASSHVMSLVKGFAVVSALTLIPQSMIDEDDGEQFTTQIMYAYTTNSEGVLDPLRSSRVFSLIALTAIIGLPHLRSALLKKVHNSKVVSTICEAFELVVFDGFTSQVFTDSGDSFCDLAIVIGSFSILWQFQSIADEMQGIQQYTTWRTASFVSRILNDIDLNGVTLAVIIFTISMLDFKFNNTSIINRIPWIQDLMFLVGLNGILDVIQTYIKNIGTIDGIPVLFGLVIIISTINNAISHYAQLVQCTHPAT